GSFHRQIIGSSLVFFILGGLPWSLSLPIMLKRAKCEPWRYDLILLSAWAAAPSLFFFFARSHLPTYVLPGLPPLAVLIALQFGGVEKFLARHLKWIVLGFLSFPLLVWALDSHFEISIFAIAILTFAMSVFIMAPLLGRCDRERIVAPVRFFSVICACVVFIQPLMDDLSSTRDVFEDLVENGLQKGKVAYFPQDVPFSAYIYSPIPVYGEELTHLRILEERPRDVLVFTRKKNLHTMTRGEELAKGDLFTDGKWSVREFTAEEARF
ncbi:MAG: hypothetical protein KDD60_05685, partial [Bdellovibrionales bacterium]|nr:hypothetical protein [Bdellovibrionales bacterium]